MKYSTIVVFLTLFASSQTISAQNEGWIRLGYSTLMGYVGYEHLIGLNHGYLGAEVGLGAKESETYDEVRVSPGFGISYYIADMDFPPIGTETNLFFYSGYSINSNYTISGGDLHWHNGFDIGAGWRFSNLWYDIKVGAGSRFLGGGEFGFSLILSVGANLF